MGNLRLVSGIMGIASPRQDARGALASAPATILACTSFQGLSLGMLLSSAFPTGAEMLVQEIILFKLHYVRHGVRSYVPKTTLAGKQLLKLSLETHTFLIFLPQISFLF